MAELDHGTIFGPLYVNGDTKLRRALNVSGIISGNGSGITNVNASNITTGQISHSFLPYATKTTKGAMRVEVTGDTIYFWTQD